MDTNRLADALRDKASQLRGLNTETSADDDVLRDAATLLRVLAHVVDGKPLSKAFGAPGDWGYDTAIGHALSVAPVVPNAELSGPRPLAAEGSRSNDVLESKPQWRAECIYCAGWGAKRWAVFFVDGNGTAVEQSMHNGKKRTFLREARAEAEAARLNAAMLSNDQK